MQTEQIPTSYMRDLPVITEEEVNRKIMKAKKITSSVPGDLTPKLYYKLYGSILARPIAHIFNQVIGQKCWPDFWKQEQVTIIPKGPSPEDFGGCRNISCTNFLSKVLETFVIEWARSEVSLRKNQYGGEPKCSATHLVVQMLDNLTTALEDNTRSAVVMTAIDFSKAFNRLEHNSCLESFKRKGGTVH